MRNKLLFFVAISFSIIISFATNPITANAQDIQCKCAHSGQVGANGAAKNQYSCTDGHTGDCGNGEIACNDQAGHLIDTGHVDTNNCSGPAIAKGLCHPNIVPINYKGVACTPGKTTTGKNAVECRCYTKNLDPNAPYINGQPASIQCINNTDTKPTWKTISCGGAAICVSPTNLFYTWTGNGSIKVPGIACEKSCLCDGTNGDPGTHGPVGPHKNGYRCYDAGNQLGGEIYCGNQEQYCQNDPKATNGISCINNTSCTCSADKRQIDCISKGSGNNGEDQTFNVDCGDGTCITGGNANDPNFTVFNQKINGIMCQHPLPPTPLPNPPSPPCQKWGSNGVCQSFGSTFGPFSTDPSGFIEKVFSILLSMSGGIALLLIIRAGYQLMTSQGKPEQLQNARDQLTAAIVGLIFLIFSFVFLELIGFNILRIPGFGSGQPSINNTAICNPNSCIPTTLCTSKNPGHCNTTGCPGGQSCVQ